VIFVASLAQCRSPVQRGASGFRLSAGEWIRLAVFSLSRDLPTLLTNPDCAQGASAEAVTYNLSQYRAIGARDAGQFRLAQASPSLDSDGHTLEQTI
jgi:hypothetical protein